MYEQADLRQDNRWKLAEKKYWLQHDKIHSSWNLLSLWHPQEYGLTPQCHNSWKLREFLIQINSKSYKAHSILKKSLGFNHLVP